MFKNSDVKFFFIIYAILNYSLSIEALSACLKYSDVGTFLLFVAYLIIFNQLLALSAEYKIQMLILFYYLCNIELFFINYKPSLLYIIYNDLLRSIVSCLLYLKTLWGQLLTRSAVYRDLLRAIVKPIFCI